MSESKPLFQKYLFITKILAIRWLSGVFPNSTARLFATLWFKVTKPKPHRRRHSLLQQAAKFEIPHRGQYLPIYQLQHTAPQGQVVLIHGWSGRWDQLTEIAESLYTNGLMLFFLTYHHMVKIQVSVPMFLSFQNLSAKLQKHSSWIRPLAFATRLGF